jgi:hypothetical protein
MPNATITASVIVEDAPQQDGRHWIRERHTDNAAVDRVIIYLRAPADPTAAAQLATHAAQLALDLRAGEIAANVSGVMQNGSLFVASLNYSIAADNFAALRAVYLAATDRQVIMIGDFLHSLTSLQLQAAFGLTAGQVTTLMANKLTPASVLATSIRTTTGQ